ncbi:phosphohistidine phosphatase [Saccharopolyspora kobensis]|uniref:Phosphohistidine phosphatase n=2 Tax=Saccharopolyspora kobensis TaxID=146035 RepID=A0A1H5VW03_9PSEU|nr:histidine phosphatase family protein [Saccharopolyspora kobensis]SEF91414.1 phosphohistidine phosphatase [Saccharopolyspora kobensis]SFC56259.1 phosphohistidine phosphatase [Saccharopolyspora kobensis]
MVDAQRELVLIRHAKSAWPDDADDFDRPLAERGRRDAPALGRWLRKHAAAVELVLCSPATRARQTWELAAPEIPAEPVVTHDDRIYVASARELLLVVHEIPKTVMTAAVIGHNPGLEDLVSLLTGEPAVLKTAAVAVLSTPSPWSAIGENSATAVEFAKPRG